jgi:peptidoglycan L-alanyl-D-glutamate endopeptidase CwlK
MLTYDSRNRKALEELAPNTKVAAKLWYEYCVNNKIDILITDAVRTIEEQKADVASGASHTMKSYHLVGQALDFVPIINGKADWSKYGNANIKLAIAKAIMLGFEWGGTWTTLVDKPHLQFNYKGYGTDKEVVAVKETLSAAVIAEIKRKAQAGIPLVGATAEKNAIYKAEVQKEYSYVIQIKGVATRAEVDKIVALANTLALKSTVTRG